MKKLIAVLLALLLPFTLAVADPFHETNAVTISFDTDAAAGCAWTGSVLSGDSVVLDAAGGTYAVIEETESLSGTGGQTHFTLIPVKTGESILVFTRAHGGEPDEQLVLLASVEDDLLLFVYDVTGGVLEGTVASVDEFGLDVIVRTESHGEVSAAFPMNTQLPAAGEKIVLYTAGIYGDPGAPISVSVVAWKPVE